MSRLWRYRTVLLLGFPLLLVGLYSLLGFVILPFVVQQTLTHSFAEHIQQTVEVGDIRINPYRLQVKVSGLRIVDKKQVTLLGVEELFLDVEPFSLLSSENIIEQVRLQKPHITFAGDKQGHAELLDVMTRAQTFLSTADDSKATPLPAVWIQQLQIEDGLVDFSHKELDKHLHEQWHFQSISLKDFHTRDTAHANALSVAMDDDHKGNFRLDSVVRLEPLSISGKVAISGFDSTRFMSMVFLPYALQLQPLQVNAQGDFIATLTDTVHVALKQGSVELQHIALKQQPQDAAVLEISRLNVTGIAMTYPEQQLSIDSIRLHDIAINDTVSRDSADKKLGSPVVFFPTLAINNIAINALQQQVNIASVELQDGQSDVVLDKQGKLNLQLLADSIIQEQPLVKMATSKKSARASSKPWNVSIAAANIINHHIHVRNEQLATPLDIQLFPVNMAVQDIKPLDEKNTFPMQLTMVIAAEGVDRPAALDIVATIKRETMSAEAKATLTQLPLKILQPYVDEQATVDIKKGSLNAKLDLLIAAKDKFTLDAKGNVDILDLNVRKKNSKKKLLAWERLAMDQLHFSSKDNTLHIADVTVDKSYGRFIINADGTSNVQDLLIENTKAVEPVVQIVAQTASGLSETALSETALSETALSETALPETALPETTLSETAQHDTEQNTDSVINPESPATNMLVVEGEKPFQFDIDSVKIHDGEMGFSDLSLSPSFRLVLKQLNGEIKQMSSSADVQATVHLQGKVNRYAPANIAGTFNVLSEKPQLNMQVNFKNIDLTTFTPYSGVYAGYVINKGQISVDLHYRLVNEKIQGENRIIISQLTLGDKVKSDKIINVPVKLAIALLQDENGLIDLGFKVNGNINDPQFDVGEIIYTAFKDTLKKVASAPFKFFKNLFKRKEHSIQNLVFDEGSDVINPATEQKLKAVAMILHKRDLLQLNIQGNALPEKDIPALQQKILLETLEADSGIPESEFLPAANPATNTKTYQAVTALYKTQQVKLISNLEEHYAQTLPEKTPQNAVQIKQLAYQQAWQELTNGMPVTADDIDDLAIERAREVKALLVEKYKVGAERIFVLSTKADTAEQSLITQLILDSR